jgi:CRP/FNR family cyclic AMP-dependent transcriptional regulator
MASLDPDIEQAAAASFLGELRRQELEDLLRESEAFELPAEAHVLRPGESERAWLLVSGLIRRYMLGPDGRRLTVGYATPGQVVGLAPLLRSPAVAGAQTAVASRLVRLNTRRLRELFTAQPSLLLAAAAERIERDDRTILRLATSCYQSVRQRVAAYVLDLLGANHQAGSLLPLTQQELGDAVGASRESVARALAAFRRAGIVATGPGRLEVVDPNALEEVLNQEASPRARPLPKRTASRGRPDGGPAVIPAARRA